MLRSDLNSLLTHLKNNTDEIKSGTVFLFAAGLLYVYFPAIGLAIIAALLVQPLRLILYACTRYTFNEDDWNSPSPVVSNITNIWFVFLLIAFGVLPIIYSRMNIGITWSDWGQIPTVMSIISIFVLTWSESTYAKNYYFDHWHPLERITLISTGALCIFSPVFIPIFLIFHSVIGGQFRHPEQLDERFNWTHSHLPYNVLLIMSGFIIIRLFADIQANTVLFLLLSGYAANYVHAGLAKLRINPIYYIMNNNPVNLFMNAYKMGWNSFISEESVLKIRNYSNKYRVLINILVLLIEIGMIFIFLSHYVAAFFALLGFILHLLIFAHDGDCFWKWMLFDMTVAASLFVAGSSMTILTNNRWLISSLVFILLANGWMNAKELGWLDSPYVEYFKFEGHTAEKAQWIPINPNIFRPYDFMLTQGVTGTLNFLTDEESLTYSYGNISLNGRTVDAHRQIVNLSNKGSVEPHEVKSVVRNFGTSEYKNGSKEKLSELVKLWFNSDHISIGNRIFRFISSPREFYSTGLSDNDSYRRASDFEKVRLRRVSGIWTDDGFKQVDEQQMLSVNVSNNHNQASDQD